MLVVLLIFLTILCRASHAQPGIRDKRPQNPCPNLFRYVATDSGWVGKVTINFVPPGKHRVKVGFSQTPEIELNENGKITLYHNEQIVEGRLKRGEPISFRVNFPTPGVLPKLTLISFNNAVLCRGSPYPPPSTSFELQHELTYSNRRPSTARKASADERASNDGSTRSTKTPSSARPPVTTATTQGTTTTTEGTTTTTQGTTTTTEQPSAVVVPQSNPFLQTAFHQATTNCGHEGADVVEARVVPLILGGDDIVRGRFPWLAAIKHPTHRQDWIFKCGGTLISARSVLTAAHCLHDATLTTIRVRAELGRHDINARHEDTELYIPTERVVLHPDYMRRSLPDADVGLVLLQQSVQFTSHISPICLWSGPSDLQRIAGNIGLVVGWGIDESGSHSAVPKAISVPIVSELECRQSHPIYFNLLTERTFCAGKLDGSGPLKGDSGGALMMQRSGRWMLRGVVSVGFNKNRYENDSFVVYCDVAKLTTWIQSELEGFT